MSRSSKTRRSESNRNSRIVSKPRNNSLYGRTSFTQGRDEGSLVAVVNTESNNATQLVLSRSGTTVQLSGKEARTLFALLEKHYYG